MVGICDNGLVIGDACVFESIKADELTRKVHIFRSRVEENSTNLHTGSVSIGKNCIIQFDGSKHTESSDAFGPVSSNRTSSKTDTKNSFTGQQGEKSLGLGSLYNRRKRGRPRASEANMETSACQNVHTRKSLLHDDS